MTRTQSKKQMFIDRNRIHGTKITQKTRDKDTRIDFLGTRYMSSVTQLSYSFFIWLPQWLPCFLCMYCTRVVNWIGIVHRSHLQLQVCTTLHMNEWISDMFLCKKEVQILILQGESLSLSLVTFNQLIEYTCPSLLLCDLWVMFWCCFAEPEEALYCWVSLYPSFTEISAK